MTTLYKNLLTVFAAVTVGVAGGRYLPPEVFDPSESNETDVEDVVPAKLVDGRVMEERSCLSLPKFVKDPQAYKDESSYDSLMAIYNAASFSREMLDKVIDTAPYMRLCDMKLSANVRATYNNIMIGVDFERDRTTTDYVTSIVHEMAHHYQTLKGADNFDIKRRLADNQRIMMAMETAAPVAELVALHAAEQAGTIDWRSDLDPKDYKYKHMTRFSEHYDAQIKDGHDHDTALNLTAKQGWQVALQEQFRLDHYNKLAVRYTLLNLEDLKPEHVDYQDPKLYSTISTTGFFSDTIRFTSLSEMPESADLFGKNMAMRAIFDAVEWYRLNTMLGPDDPQVIAGKQELTATKNPYANVEFDTVICKIDQGGDVQEAFDSSVKRQPPVRYTPLPHRPAAKGTPYKGCSG